MGSSRAGHRRVRPAARSTVINPGGRTRGSARTALRTNPSANESGPGILDLAPRHRKTIMAYRRICSLLPSATEIVCALGLEDRLVAVTHECDYPASVVGKPVV